MLDEDVPGWLAKRADVLAIPAAQLVYDWRVQTSGKQTVIHVCGARRELVAGYGVKLDAIRPVAFLLAGTVAKPGPVLVARGNSHSFSLSLLDDGKQLYFSGDIRPSASWGNLSLVEDSVFTDFTSALAAEMKSGISMAGVQPIRGVACFPEELRETVLPAFEFPVDFVPEESLSAVRAAGNRWVPDLADWRARKKKKALLELGRLAAMVGSAVATALAAVAIIVLWNKHSADSGLAALRQANSTYEIRKQALHKMALEEKSASAERKALIALSKSRGDSLRMFKTLLAAKPDGVFLTNLREQGVSLILAGVAQSPTAAAKFAETLSASREVSAASVAAVRAVGSGEYSFLLNVRMRHAAKPVPHAPVTPGAAYAGPIAPGVELPPPPLPPRVAPPPGIPSYPAAPTASFGGGTGPSVSSNGPAASPPPGTPAAVVNLMRRKLFIHREVANGQR
jgi:Tfp pilus assembly protein PilN